MNKRKTKLLISLLVIFIIIVGYVSVSRNELESETLPPEPDMPAFSESFEKMRDFYDIRFIEDGYPARYRDGELFIHPIYGAYVLTDYIKQYKTKPTNELLAAIKKVANSSIKRMDEFNGALVFWYPEGDYVSRAYKKHYSGLTQAYYALQLHETYMITKDEKYKIAADKVFNSFLIPVEDGGVNYTWDMGVSLEEFPAEPNSFILNGWLTMLDNIYKYATISNNPKAQELFKESTETLAKLLPLYDAPEYKNSRYSLTGFQYTKLIFGPNSQGVEIVDYKLKIPGEKTFTIDVEYDKEANRWRNFIFGEDLKNEEDKIILKNNQLRANIVLSRVSYPEENVLCLEISTPEEKDLEVQIYSGEYSPFYTSQLNNQWKAIKNIKLGKGMNKIEVTIPWEFSDLIAYPTNFKKIINNKNYNVYHYVHIDKLNKLYDITKLDNFKLYADKWENYTKEWKDMSVYDNVVYEKVK